MLSLRVRAHEVAGKIYYGCSFSFGNVTKNSTPPFPFAKAMDVINQVLFLIILASFTNGKLETPGLQKIDSQLKWHITTVEKWQGITSTLETKFPNATLLLKT